MTSGNITFRTLPIVGYQVIDGQDANVIDPSNIQQIVRETFYPAPKSTSSPSPSASSSAKAVVGSPDVTVDVLNGGNTQGLASQVSTALVKDGFTAGEVGNAPSALTTTEVLYGTGTSASASKIASLFHVTAAASADVAAGHVKILLGSDATLPGASATSSSSASPSTSGAVPVPSTGAQGGAVNASNGIPCVD
jgi:hypothetical protein